MIKFKPKAYFTDLDGTLLDLPKTKEGISLDNLNIVKEKTKVVHLLLLRLVVLLLNMF